jgi:hypothetical protein
MTFWYYFWLIDFAIAGSAFVIILLLVAVKGAGDLFAMFHLLDQEQRESTGQSR